MCMCWYRVSNMGCIKQVCMRRVCMGCNTGSRGHQTAAIHNRRSIGAPVWIWWMYEWLKVGKCNALCGGGEEEGLFAPLGAPHIGRSGEVVW